MSKLTFHCLLSWSTTEKQDFQLRFSATPHQTRAKIRTSSYEKWNEPKILNEKNQIRMENGKKKPGAFVFDLILILN